MKDRLSLKQTVSLDGEPFESLLLWRARIGEAITISDESGFLFRARVVALESRRARLYIHEEIGRYGARPAITLAQALPDKERMELIIEKTAELGVSMIIPFKSQKSIGLEGRDAKQKKSHKWAERALKAAKQSRRDSIPVIGQYLEFTEALKAVKEADISVMLYEKSGALPFKDFIQRIKDKAQIKNIRVMAGPEGGFSEEEADCAIREGLTLISLGSRVLRTETAAILGVGLVSYEFGI